jgi:thiamine-monophosphate kinase
MPKRTDINELGEFGLIEHLSRDFGRQQPSTLKGIGDDTAVLDHGGPDLLLFGADMLLEGIHFDLGYTPLRHLGYKAVAVNLSDIYAMNGTPTQITVSLGLSNRFSVEAVEELYAGMRLACERYGVDLVGGDTSASRSGLVLSLSALGRVERELVCYRSGARAGDLICITGDLGAAYLGLQILEREKRIFLEHPEVQPDLAQYPYLIERQLKPEPRRDMIEAFRKNGLKPTSMIDISDGLSSDLMHLCKQSGLGAYLEESGVSMHPDAQQAALDFKLDPITCALSGGEDYELLFTIDAADIEKVKYLPDIYIAGEMVQPSDGITLHTKGGNIHPLKAQGWKHFG